MCNSCVSLAGLVLRFIACFVLLVIAPLVFIPLDHLSSAPNVASLFTAPVFSASAAAATAGTVTADAVSRRRTGWLGGVVDRASDL